MIVVNRIVGVVVVAVLLLVATLEAAARNNFSAMKSSRRVMAYSADSSAMKFRKNGKRDWWEENQTYSTRFRAEQLVVPVSLVAVGALGVGAKSPMYGMNCAIRDGLYQASKGVKLRFDDYVQYVPVAFYLTLDYMGLKAKHSFGERVVVAAVTYIAVTAISQGLKYTVREPRPDTGTRNSFPSGHTLGSFNGAISIFLYNKKWGTAALVLATLIAFSRMYVYVHFPTDIIGGILLATGCAILSYYILKRFVPERYLAKP